jgi:hypothetical protein
MTSTCRSAHLAALGAVAAALAVPTAAAATATVTVDRDCYSPGDTIRERGTGFTPGAEIAETLALLDPETSDPFGQLVAPPFSADAGGSFDRRIAAPQLASRTHRRERAIAAFTDQADPRGEAPTVDWWLTAWRVEIRQWMGGRARPGRSMLVDAYGWTWGTSLYAHYYRGRTAVKTVRLGALRGSCGDMRKRVLQFPFRRPRRGRWTVAFSATRSLDPRTDPFWFYKVRVPYAVSPAKTLRWRSVVARAGSTPSSSTSSRRHSRYCRRACARRPERA